MQNRLFIFTSSFPYGSSEMFLANELQIIAKQFEFVYIIPYYGFGKQTNYHLPNNCIIEKKIVKNKFYKYLIGLYPCHNSLFYFLIDFFKHNVFFKYKKFHIWVISFMFCNNYLHNQHIRNLIKTCKSNDIFYSYWGVNTNSFFPFIPQKIKKISRFHGEWDLWEESCDNYAVNRKRILESLNMVFTISSRGAEYLENKYKISNVNIARLGTFDHGITLKSSDNIIRILSCSAVYPLKRVFFIFKTLEKYTSQKIEWTHIGDGEDFDTLKKGVQNNSNTNLKVNLLGYLSNEDVISYYKNNKVDIFINLSTNEGIPVSIMEAISFDIPVIATNVGCNNEIVCAESGILVSADPSFREIINAIDNIQSGVFQPKELWKKLFNAKNNYYNFANQIKAIIK